MESRHLEHFVFLSQLSAETRCCHWLDLIPEICKSSTKGYARMPTFRWLQVPVTAGRHTLVASRKVEGCVALCESPPPCCPGCTAAMLTDTSQGADRSIYCPYARHSDCFAFIRVMIHFCIRVYLYAISCVALLPTSRALLSAPITVHYV